MAYTQRIEKAIRFSIKTHEVHQKQKRKGKDIPYITHPLTVGIILARVGAHEDVVAAGILHDTIEDSTDEKKVTREMLAERFGENVAVLVESVTETDRSLSWEQCKQEAVEHIGTFSQDSVLVKSADVLSNTSELLDDHAKSGEEIWSRFHAPKEKMLDNSHRVISALLLRWPESPLAADLQRVKDALAKI